jgi:hypothetical protein
MLFGCNLVFIFICFCHAPNAKVAAEQEREWKGYYPRHPNQEQLSPVLSQHRLPCSSAPGVPTAVILTKSVSLEVEVVVVMAMLVKA